MNTSKMQVSQLFLFALKDFFFSLPYTHPLHRVENINAGIRSINAMPEAIVCGVGRFSCRVFFFIESYSGG